MGGLIIDLSSFFTLNFQILSDKNEKVREIWYPKKTVLHFYIKEVYNRSVKKIKLER